MPAAASAATRGCGGAGATASSKPGDRVRASLMVLRDDAVELFDDTRSTTLSRSL